VALLSDDLTFSGNLPPALLAAAPRHPLWLEALRATAAATRNGRTAPPPDVTPAVVLKAAVARLLAAHEAGGGDAIARAAARSLPLRSVAAIRKQAAQRVLAVRVPGLCVAPAGAAFPYDWHVAAGEVVDAEKERAMAAVCSSGSEEFNPDRCYTQLGIASAAAYTIAYWQHVPMPAKPHKSLWAWLVPSFGSGVGGRLLESLRNMALLVAAVLLLVGAAANLLGAGGWERGGSSGGSSKRGSRSSSRPRRRRKQAGSDDDEQLLLPVPPAR